MMITSLWLRISSIASLLLGFGYTLSVYLFLQAILLWQLATIAKRGLSPVRAQIVVFFLATLAATLLAWRYLFAVPAAFSALVAACVGVALITTARRQARATRAH